MTTRPVFLAALIVWVAALGGGFTILLKYKSTPGAVDERAPERWPAASRVPRPRDRASLVMFAHPHCPCTRASIGELARLLAGRTDQLAAYVLFLRPREVSSDWDGTDLWRSAAAIPGVTVLRDDDGAEAERFHALTSGVTFVYDSEGRLLFRGGITPSRGHEGDSFGRQRIISLLTNGYADRSDGPVFGCALGHRESPSANSLEDES